ncbi:MAG: 2-oxo acid dehydrogenase subunit E2 [Holosporaceae bacterium]|jgi:pyruvate/2-oxoglutarate dehydrogenase complex dihydrolipoamide acyltransferase (E2) component|nr:2-oxo acid dehydrogenase subunit E2 [Holosporaceae bacterium]
MRVDIIVPNFDDTSYEVTLTAWYKKVGERISKNEIIADAETSTVACGVTSSYDCLLAKIIAKEGAVIPQGAKIAVIETDVNADISQDTEIETMLEKSVELMEFEKNMFAGGGHEAAKKNTKNLRNSHVGEAVELEMIDAAVAMEYSLSVPEPGHEFAAPAAFDAAEVSPTITSFASSALEELENVSAIRDEILEELSEETEEKFKSILRTTEHQAREEAKKLKEKILDEAMKLALSQGEELKSKILNEYEQTALKDAGEMHRKIVEGSITEAENTKNKLIIEAVEKAREEAEVLRQDILQKTETDTRAKANAEGEILKQDILRKAEQEAAVTAEAAREEILKKADEDAAAAAEIAKQDILQKAEKDAIVAAETLKHDILQKAEQNAADEADVLRRYILQKNERQAMAAAEEIEHCVLKEAEKEARIEAEEIKEEILADTIRKADAEAAVLEESIIQEALVEESLAEESLAEEYQVKKTLIEESVVEKIEIAELTAELIGADDPIRDDVINEALEITEAAETMENEYADSLTAENSYPSTFGLNVHSNGPPGDYLEHLSMAEANGFLSNGNGHEHYSKHSGGSMISEEILSSIRDEVTQSLKGLFAEIKVLADTEVKKAVSHIEKSAKIAKENCHSAAATDLGKKLVEEKVEELKTRNEVINKLLHTPVNDGTPEMYADNWSKPTFFSSPGDEKVPIDFLKQRINEKLKSSMDSSVISTVSNEVDMNAVLNMEKTFGKEFSKRFNTRLGFTPFFIIACISALKKYRVFNANIHGHDLIYKNCYDISVITCGNDGVAAPVIRNADVLSIAEIEKHMIALSRRAVEGTLSVEEVSGGTFTVVNAGVYGSLMGTDLLTTPQVATLSVHRMHNRPVATDTGVEIKPMLYISLSYDHRVADTKTASDFLCSVKNYVENPGWTILGL